MKLLEMPTCPLLGPSSSGFISGADVDVNDCNNTQCRCLKDFAFQTRLENSLSLCGSFTQSSSLDPHSHASEGLNHSDAATGDGPLCGIVATAYCDPVSFLACKLLTMFPSE